MYILELAYMLLLFGWSIVSAVMSVFFCSLGLIVPAVFCLCAAVVGVCALIYWAYK